MDRPPQYVSVNAVNTRTGDWAAPDGRVTSAGVYTLSGLNTQAIRISFVATRATHDPAWHPDPVSVVAGSTRNLDLHVPTS
ncbi:hypothetical protein [Saccharothrix deserti]|uniref:hypothetical protein n=1 Tax=Saccharothrix deserti TaxID=2593674 RepID=UPI00131D09AF|nr:hypothetical protein [Saccharothrix deserti]